MLGSNAAGQLNVPAGTYKAVDASAFQQSVCAVRTDDTLVCWGSPNESMTASPAGTFVDVSMGLVHGCAIRTTGTVACWGRNFWSAKNAPANATFVQIAAGFEYTCGLKSDGFIQCWGGGGVGQTNPPNGAGPFTAISAGYAGSCAVRTDGQLRCWGNRFGTEGVAVAGNDWTDVSGGAFGYCALNSAGGIDCGHTNSAHLFRDNAPAGAYVQVDMGGRHACGIVEDGGARCWSGDPDPLNFSIEAPQPPNVAPTATFSAPSSVNEGSPIALSIGAIMDEDPATVTIAFDCGSGFGTYGSMTSVLCPTDDNGVRTVQAAVKDAEGLTTTYTASVTIDNVGPTVSSFSGATIFAGETYSASGSFADPGADSWTAVVNYGAGITGLALSGMSFALANTYATAGTYLVKVSITDDDGRTGSGGATVTVLAPAGATATMGPKLDNLVSSGKIDATDAAPLKEKVASASESFDKGNTTAGVNKLDAFINQVSALEKSKRLDPTSADELSSTAERIKVSAGGGPPGKKK